MAARDGTMEGQKVTFRVQFPYLSISPPLASQHALGVALGVFTRGSNGSAPLLDSCGGTPFSLPPLLRRVPTPQLRVVARLRSSTPDSHRVLSVWLGAKSAPQASTLASAGPCWPPSIPHPRFISPLSFFSSRMRPKRRVSHKCERSG